MMKHYKRLLTISVLACALVVGCAKKKTNPDEGIPSTSGQQNSAVDDTNVQNKDLSFDPQGSDSGNIAGLYTIHFDYDKSALSSEARSNLEKNAAWMKAHPTATVQVEGHCDRHGSIEYNLALGERRAKAVKNYLISLGTDSKKLTSISYGKEKPLDSSETETADAKNRRANFVVQSTK